MSTLKTCNTCRRSLPLSDFYKNNQQRDGRTGRCGACIRVWRKAYDHRYNRTAKAKAAVHRYATSAKGRATKRRYARMWSAKPENRARLRELYRKYNGQDRYRAQQKAYLQSAKGKAQKAAKDKRYAQTASAKWIKRRVARQRKYLLATALCTLTREEWEAIKASFHHRCAYCRKATRLEMDHVIPLAKKGTHTKANVIPACRSCNAKKGAQIIVVPA